MFFEGVFFGVIGLGSGSWVGRFVVWWRIGGGIVFIWRVDGWGWFFLLWFFGVDVYVEFGCVSYIDGWFEKEGDFIIVYIGCFSG